MMLIFSYYSYSSNLESSSQLHIAETGTGAGAGGSYVPPSTPHNPAKSTSSRALAATARKTIMSAAEKNLNQCLQTYITSCHAVQAEVDDLCKKYIESLTIGSYSELIQNTAYLQKTIGQSSLQLDNKMTHFDQFLITNLKADSSTQDQAEYHKTLTTLSSVLQEQFYNHLTGVRELKIRIAGLKNSLKVNAEILADYHKSVQDVQSISTIRLYIYDVPVFNAKITALEAKISKQKTELIQYQSLVTNRSTTQREKETIKSLSNAIASDQIELTKLKLKREYARTKIEARAAIKTNEAYRLLEAHAKDQPSIFSDTFNAFTEALGQTVKDQGTTYATSNKLSDSTKQFLESHNISSQQLDTMDCTAIERHLFKQIGDTVTDLSAISGTIQNNPQLSALNKLANSALECCSTAASKLQSETTQGGIAQTNLGKILTYIAGGIAGGVGLITGATNQEQIKKMACDFGNALKNRFYHDVKKSSESSSGSAATGLAQGSGLTTSGLIELGMRLLLENKSGKKENSKDDASNAVDKTPNQNNKGPDFYDKIFSTLSTSLPFLNDNYVKIFGRILFAKLQPYASNAEALINAFNNLQQLPQQHKVKIVVELIANLFDPHIRISPETQKFIQDANSQALWDTHLKGALASYKDGATQGLNCVMVTKDIANIFGFNINSTLLPVFAELHHDNKLHTTADIMRHLHEAKEGYENNKAPAVFDLESAEDVFDKAAKSADSIGFWCMPRSGWVIHGRLYTQNALERMAPRTSPMRVELITRAHSRGLASGTAAYNNFIESLGVAPSQVAHAIELGERSDLAGKEPKIGYRTSAFSVFTNSKGDVLDVSRNI